MRAGVAIDPARGSVYMMNPQGGIDAVEIASGKLLWTTKAAAKPLAVFDKQLLAQGDSTGSDNAPVVMLDTLSGKRCATLSLPVPSGVILSVQDNPGTSSSMTARIIGNEAIISWWFSQSTPSGVFPPPDPGRKVYGAFSLDIKRRTVTTINPEQAKARIEPSRSPAVATSALKGSENLYGPAQRSDGFFVGVQLLASATGTRAVVKRWTAASGEALPEISVAGNYAASTVSPDGEHLLVVTTSKGAGAGYEWALYDIASGQLVAQLPLTAWAPPFFIWHSSILVYESAPTKEYLNGRWSEEPLELHGLDLGTTSDIWKRTLRDTTYRGPQRPRA